MYGGVVAVVVKYLVSVGVLSVYLCFEGAVVVLGEQYVKEAELVVIFFFFRKYDVFCCVVDGL